jgi:hypothetical protein
MKIGDFESTGSWCMIEIIDANRERRLKDMGNWWRHKETGELKVMLSVEDAYKYCDYPEIKDKIIVLRDEWKEYKKEKDYE